MNIGNRIRELRTAKGLKIADLAEAVGVDGANISRVETGKQKSFTEQSLSKYAQALGVSVADLFTPGGNKTTVCEYSGSNPHSGDGSVFRVEILDVSAALVVALFKAAILLMSSGQSNTTMNVR